MNKLVWIFIMVFGLNTILLQSQIVNADLQITKISSDGLKITMVFTKAIEGTNKGFTIHNTTSKAFSSITGFGTTILVGTLANATVYGEAVNISYKSIETLDNIEGDLVDSDGIDVGYFLKELVDTSALIFTGTEKYVTATALGGGDGSISNPYTFEEMIINLETFTTASTTGTRFNMKAGLYGNKESSSYQINGEIGKPIIIEGYTTDAGDNPDVKWDYNTNRNMDSSLMPLFDGEGSKSLTNPFTFSASSNITVKNLQFLNYNNKNSGIYFNNSNHIFIENCIVEKFDRGINIAGNPTTCFENVVTDCIVLNGYRANFQVNGSNCLFQDNKSYADNSVGDTTDYYYSLFGNFNILRNNYGNRVGNLGHSGHGLSINTSSPGITNDSDTNITQYNFIDGHTSINMAKQIEFRHGGVKYNVARGLIAHGGTSGAKESGGIMFRDNASFNIVENAYINDTNTAIYFTESVEIGVGLGHDNIIRNSIFTNLKFAIRGENYNKGLGSGSNNKIVNCTFYNVERLIRLSHSDAKFVNNEFINNIFYNIPILSLDDASGWSFNNNNFHKSFDKPSGTGNLSIDPKFEDSTGGNFRLKPDSPLIDKGVNLNQVKSDFEGKPRPQGVSIDIGAYEFQDNTTTYLNVNAGEDQIICQGDTVTLTADGGSVYSWSTGATTASITVSPNSTTIYTVTVTEGNESDSDSVEVKVNNVTANAGSNKTINEGENITLTASGGDTYLWDTGAKSKSITVSPQETRNYTVTVYKNNCQDTDIVQVTVIENDTSPPPAIADAGEDQTICLGESITLTGSGGVTYNWSTGATTKSIQINPTRTTTYTLSATRGGVTNTDMVIVTVENCSALSEKTKQEEFIIYPNPTKGILNIDVSNYENELNLVLINLNGSIVYSDKMNLKQNGLSKQIDLSRLVKGLYFVRLFNDTQNKVKKILVI